MHKFPPYGLSKGKFNRIREPAVLSVRGSTLPRVPLLKGNAPKGTHTNSAIGEGPHSAILSFSRLNAQDDEIDVEWICAYL